MSDAFDEITGPAGLNEEDAVDITAIVEDDDIHDDDVAAIDPVIDPLEVEDDEEEEEDLDDDKADMEAVMWQDYDER